MGSFKTMQFALLEEESDDMCDWDIIEKILKSLKGPLLKLYFHFTSHSPGNAVPVSTFSLP